MLTQPSAQTLAGMRARTPAPPGGDDGGCGGDDGAWLFNGRLPAMAAKGEYDAPVARPFPPYLPFVFRDLFRPRRAGIVAGVPSCQPLWAFAMTHDPAPAADNGFTDIRHDGALLRFSPAAWRPYIKLARLDRPIGTWLLLLPCWWSLALAPAPLGWGALWLAALFAIGAVVMRGAGCTVNDILDRKFDALVERTRSRPIPSGQVTVKQALAFLAAQLLIGLAVLLQLNGMAVALGVGSLALVFLYPLMKRITWWPQAFLGLAFNWGALMGWTAVTGEIGWPALILYAAGIAWTLGYDTIYAHQDKEDDARIGVKSTALRLGDQSKIWIYGFYTLTFTGVLLAGRLAGLGLGFSLAMSLAGMQLAWQVATWRPDDQTDCLEKFKSNRWFGWLALAAILAGRI